MVSDVTQSAVVGVADSAVSPDKVTLDSASAMELGDSDTAQDDAAATVSTGPELISEAVTPESTETLRPEGTTTKSRMSPACPV